MADQKIDGAPSVLYDAVCVLASDEGVADLVGDPAAREFVVDAFNHCKFIGYTEPVSLLFDKTGLSELMDDGFVELSPSSIKAFLDQCAELRRWERYGAVSYGLLLI